MLAPIIRLQPLTYEELLVLIEKLMQIPRRLLWLDAHAYRERLGGLSSRLSFGRVGEPDTHLTPREVIRDFIELLGHPMPETPMPTLPSYYKASAAIASATGQRIARITR